MLAGVEASTAEGEEAVIVGIPIGTHTVVQTKKAEGSARLSVRARQEGSDAHRRQDDGAQDRLPWEGGGRQPLAGCLRETR